MKSTYGPKLCDYSESKLGFEERVTYYRESNDQKDYHSPVAAVASGVATMKFCAFLADACCLSHTCSEKYAKHDSLAIKISYGDMIITFLRRPCTSGNTGHAADLLIAISPLLNVAHLFLRKWKCKFCKFLILFQLANQGTDRQAYSWRFPKTQTEYPRFPINDYSHVYRTDVAHNEDLDRGKSPNGAALRISVTSQTLNFCFRRIYIFCELRQRI